MAAGQWFGSTRLGTWLLPWTTWPVTSLGWQLAELRCGLACCWLGSCQNFQERGEGRDGETSLLSCGWAGLTVPQTSFGDVDCGQGTWFVHLDILMASGLCSGLSLALGFER